ncbi:Glycosyl transferases group 1 [Desulfomicrobium norvegicum]|uniref:Glycosyl transferases group 1 n=1 Tax=Desulfomicrobium norvegicum (strain DSM 1741 / NCIMB 8310) TaxID=52561 RepID=A0A8G2C1G0_DESNO|nr:glycosyltransferase [Desulfomicrobium norvegicum]SFL50639.1 Glycosyl transferases group 1 [Desulfomicrobium norvegicum]
MKRVWWHLSDYISHRRAGEAYRRCLVLAGFEIVERPEEADLAVLHDDPMNWSDILERYPAARAKPKVGFAVWEGLALPDVYRAGFALVDEIWTASAFSAEALGQGHVQVKVLPHVVELATFAPEDLEWARTRLGVQSRGRYFFSIVDAINPRKNLDALLRVFARLAHSNPDVVLVLKQYRMSVSFGGGAQIVSIGESVSDARMAALHSGALAYVAPHRGEAWGLGLSEAMSHGVPVLATGWSGNMEFMDQRNSVPLRFELEPVGERMSRMLPHFRPEMLWARVDEEHLLREMLRLVRRGPDPGMCKRARAVAERFSPRRVSRILTGLIREFEEKAGSGATRISI